MLQFMVNQQCEEINIYEISLYTRISKKNKQADQRHQIILQIENIIQNGNYITHLFNLNW